MKPVDNSFQGPKEIDLNNPPKEPYEHQEFPKLVYGERGHVLTVKNAEEHDAAIAKGFKEDPHPHFDYSQVNNGKAARRAVDPDDEDDDQGVAVATSARGRAGRSKKQDEPATE